MLSSMHAAGLGGTLKFWCHECQCVTHRLPLSKALHKGKRGPGIAEANLRLVLGAAQNAQSVSVRARTATDGHWWAHAET